MKIFLFGVTMILVLSAFSEIRHSKS